MRLNKYSKINFNFSIVFIENLTRNWKTIQLRTKIKNKSHKNLSELTFWLILYRSFFKMSSFPILNYDIATFDMNTLKSSDSVIQYMSKLNEKHINEVSSSFEWCFCSIPMIILYSLQWNSNMFLWDLNWMFSVDNWKQAHQFWLWKV